MEGIIFVLANSAMPSILLIETASTNLEMENSLKKFYNESVPLPFYCLYAGIIADYKEMDSLIKVALSNYRINKERNFFSASLEQVLSILHYKEVKNLTDQLQENQDDFSVDSSTKPNNSQPVSSNAILPVESGREYKQVETNIQNFVDFRRLNIPINSIIVCEPTNERALVKSNFVIEFRGQNTTLYNATRLALGDDFDNKKSILSYWSFNNKSIK